MRGLEREVLDHLKRYHASKWDTLYNHFAVARGTDIQLVLHALKDVRYIKVIEDQTVRITASGLTRLEKHNY